MHMFGIGVNCLGLFQYTTDSNFTYLKLVTGTLHTKSTLIICAFFLWMEESEDPLAFYRDSAGPSNRTFATKTHCSS